MAGASIAFRVYERERDELVSRAAREKVNLSDYIRVRLGLRAQGFEGDDDVEVGSRLERTCRPRWPTTNGACRPSRATPAACRLTVLARMVYAGEVKAGGRAVAPFRALAEPVADLLRRAGGGHAQARRSTRQLRPPRARAPRRVDRVRRAHDRVKLPACPASPPRGRLPPARARSPTSGRAPLRASRPRGRVPRPRGRVARQHGAPRHPKRELGVHRCAIRRRS
jgi:hypothetical protein